MLLRLTRMLGMALAAGLMLITVPAPASANSVNTVYLTILWIHCNDQSEPGSDEIRLMVNGSFVAGWNDVDGGERHWYYSSFPTPINIPFNGNTVINVYEEDGDLGLIGWVNIAEGEVNQGEIQKNASQIDGNYDIRYYITG